MNEFERLILSNLNDIKSDISGMKTEISEIKSKLDEHDKRFDAIDKRFDTVENKLNAIAEQTAKNTEFNTSVKAKHEQLENEITEIKKRLEV